MEKSMKRRDEFSSTYYMPLLGTRACITRSRSCALPLWFDIKGTSSWLYPNISFTASRLVNGGTIRFEKEGADVNWRKTSTRLGKKGSSRSSVRIGLFSCSGVSSSTIGFTSAEVSSACRLDFILFPFQLSSALKQDSTIN